MVGLDAAGKTTILYKLKLGEIVTTIPTIGAFTRLFSSRSLCDHTARGPPGGMRGCEHTTWPAPLARARIRPR